MFHKKLSVANMSEVITEVEVNEYYEWSTKYCSEATIVSITF